MPGRQDTRDLVHIEGCGYIRGEELPQSHCLMLVLDHGLEIRIKGEP